MEEEKTPSKQEISGREKKRDLAGVGGGAIPGNGGSTNIHKEPSVAAKGTHDLVGGPVQGKLGSSSKKIPKVISGDQDATHGNREGHEPDEGMRDPMSARSPEQLKQPDEHSHSANSNPK